MNTGWTQERFVRLLLDGALVHRERGQTQRAEVLLSEALDLSRKEQKPELMAATLACQGVLERQRGNLEAAAERLQEAISLRRSVSDSFGIARALGDLGGVHLEAGRQADAYRCIEEALGLTAPLEPGRTRAEVLEQAGCLHEKLGSPDRASECFADALEIYEGMGDVVAIARVRSRQGRGQTPPAPRRNLDEELGEIERRRLIEALDAETWNQSRAARRLGVTETRVRNLMRRHGLRPRNRRGRPRKTGESRSK
jgi:tetratricopeptide (TPR) repeat protein